MPTLQKHAARCFYVQILHACVHAQAYQVDWEAILSRSVEPFIASVSSWLYPAAAQSGTIANTPAPEAAKEFASLPPVKTVLSTVRQRLNAMNAS